VSSRILIIDEDESHRESLAQLLAAEGCAVLSAACEASAFEMIEQFPIDAVLCDLGMPGLDGFDLTAQIARRLPGIPILLMSAHGTEDLAVEAIQRGVYGYLAEPFQPAEIRLALLNLEQREDLRRRHDHLDRELTRTVGDRAIVAASDGMIALLELLERTASFKSTVLVTGESGTGKEVIARAVHAQSPRRNAPFITIRCAATPDNLLESELFGHAKGAFIGASQARRGLFAEADKGTLFLDEIAELPSSLQVKLLRAIREEEIQPVGETKSQAIDVRVIAATARDLDAEVAAGRFDEDLFDRLDVVRLEVPALRKRRQDIPLLVDHFLSRLRSELGKNVRSVSDEALDLLVAYHWPGNVRELENMIERAMILSDGNSVEIDALPAAIRTARDVSPAGIQNVADPINGDESFCLKSARQAFEAQLIRRALARTGGNRTHAAKLLEISHRGLLYKIKAYGIRD
jgi:two-component system response regulator AtoC